MMQHAQQPLKLDAVRARLVSHVLLFLCTAGYLLLMAVVIYFTRFFPYDVISVLGISISRYTLNGIAAQGQVIFIILIALNPLANSHWVALGMCALTAGASLVDVLSTGNSDALPGIAIPITSSVGVWIIHTYSKNLKGELDRVLEYGRIVQQNQQTLHTLAYFDELTGLPNRKMLLNRIHELIAQPNDRPVGFFLAYADLDQFKKINDSMGHSVGDAVLCAVSQRWEAFCQGEDMLARAGGDEFVLLIRRDISPLQVSEELSLFLDALQEPIIIDQLQFYVQSSFGVARYPADGVNADELLKNADIAMYRAKLQGRNCLQFFNQTMQEELIRKIRLENDLPLSMVNHELYLVYQPQFITDTRALRGFEALLRWKHPQLGLVSPMEFIPIAEETGCILEIGMWVLREALREFDQLFRQRGMRCIVSINISVRQILEPNFVDTVREILRETGFDSSALELEITETLFLANPDSVSEVIGRLKEMGISIALDDFGTGYASLNNLHRLSVNTLKMDRAFIEEIISGTHENRMAGAIISLSHKLGIQVIAEGVETAVQMDYLQQNNCDCIQGFYLGRPMEAAMMAQLFAPATLAVCRLSHHNLLT